MFYYTLVFVFLILTFILIYDKLKKYFNIITYNTIMPGLSISVDKREEPLPLAVVTLKGFLDSNTSNDFEHTLKKLLYNDIVRIVVNMEGIDYISSAGWGVFVSEIKTIREKGGDLKLVRMIPDVFDIFKLLEFDEILNVYDSIEEAVKEF